VDGQERDNVVMNRQTFYKHYLTDYKSYCNQWIQLSIEEAKIINNLNLDFGYHIINKEEERIKFHVDHVNHMV
jgi:hypothetical protein